MNVYKWVPPLPGVWLVLQVQAAESNQPQLMVLVSLTCYSPS